MKARIGYAKIDLQDEFYKTGLWNNRPINEGAVKKLVTSFAGGGMNWRLLRNAVPIIVARSALNLKSLVPAEQVYNDDVLQNVEWVAKPTVANMANGNHRRKAHHEHLKRVEADIKLATENVEVISASATTPDELAELANAQAFRDERIAYLAESQSWLGDFYDIGESSNVHRAAPPKRS